MMGVKVFVLYMWGWDYCRHSAWVCVGMSRSETKVHVVTVGSSRDRRTRRHWVREADTSLDRPELRVHVSVCRHVCVCTLGYVSTFLGPRLCVYESTCLSVCCCAHVPLCKRTSVSVRTSVCIRSCDCVSMFLYVPLYE